MVVVVVRIECTRGWLVPTTLLIHVVTSLLLVVTASLTFVTFAVQLIRCVPPIITACSRFESAGRLIDRWVKTVSHAAKVGRVDHLTDVVPPEMFKRVPRKDQKGMREIPLTGNSKERYLDKQ